MNTHTQGPWHLNGIAVKDDPFDRVRYEVTTVGKTICNLAYTSYEGGPTNAEQDAQLIAAAPELLEALREIVCAAEAGELDEYGTSGDWYREARAAIKKATGAA